MGLLLPSGFQRGVRSIVSRLRSENADPEISLAYAEELLAWCAQEYGEAVARNLYVWAREVFDYGLVRDNGASLFLWASVVRYRGYSGYPAPPPPPSFIILLRQVIAADPPLDFDEPAPVSEWDRSMYAWREYDVEIYTPMTTVSLTIDNFRFRRAWSKTHQAMLQTADFPSVKLWALEVARQMQMPLDRLGDPGSWPELPTLL